MVRSNEQEFVFGGPDAEVGVYLEPRRGHTAEDVAKEARQSGASEVVVLPTGVVSARGTREKLESLKSVASATPKATKQMRPR